MIDLVNSSVFPFASELWPEPKRLFFEGLSSGAWADVCDTMFSLPRGREAVNSSGIDDLSVT